MFTYARLASLSLRSRAPPSGPAFRRYPLIAGPHRAPPAATHPDLRGGHRGTGACAGSPPARGRRQSHSSRNSAGIFPHSVPPFLGSNPIPPPLPGTPARADNPRPARQRLALPRSSSSGKRVCAGPFRQPKLTVRPGELGVARILQQTCRERNNPVFPAEEERESAPPEVPNPLHAFTGMALSVGPPSRPPAHRTTRARPCWIVVN
jgi:hypothetical protein